MKFPRPNAHRYTHPLSKAAAWVADGVAATFILGAVACAVAFGVWIVRGAPGVTTNYSTRPPEQVFQTVLNQPTPQGVSHLQVSGHGVLGHIVWMKFSATDAAIHALLESKRLSLDGPHDGIMWVSKQQVAQDDDALAIGWQEAFGLKKPEAYSYEFVPPGRGWVGEIIIHRENHIVYVNAGLL